MQMRPRANAPALASEQLAVRRKWKEAGVIYRWAAELSVTPQEISHNLLAFGHSRRADRIREGPPLLVSRKEKDGREEDMRIASDGWAQK